ncbi:sulfatase-like hydrolase/transferase [Paraglaciecola sp.]|uniref:sulfatase-like hydrolase/transferase n=1 Tax=Paraglaciecola sp. TaxID=1920173 RepID=UPI003EF42F63
MFACQNTTVLSKLESKKKSKKAPNVIIIVADQMRRAAMGFWSQPEYQDLLNGKSDHVITPNLDQLATNGVVFNQAIANFPLCSPFRGMLMSGMFPNNNGVNNNTRKDRPDTGLKIELDTMPEVFNSAGYNTALFGKAHWHNNFPLFDDKGVYQGSTQLPGGHFLKITDYDTYIPPGPGRHGIQYWYQTIGHDHDKPVVYSNDPNVIGGNKDGSPHYLNAYTAVNQANVIIDYIKNNNGQRDNDKPFSLLWAMDPPHNPYAEMSDTDEQIYNEFYKHPVMQKLLNRPNVDIHTAKKYFRVYFSMITLIDREIGRVMNTLKQQGLSENTLVVFTADHGEMMGSHSKMAKNVFYEESLGIPLIMSLPNKLEHHVNDLLINVPDFMPTILSLVGLKNNIPKNLDGTDHSAHLSSNPPVDKPKSSLYYGKVSELGVRTDQYTMALNNSGQLIGLFDNIKDPYQLAPLTLQNIPASDKQLLLSELGNWLAKINHEWYKQRKYPKLIIYPD